jgi:hypothetical protein
MPISKLPRNPLLRWLSVRIGNAIAWFTEVSLEAEFERLDLRDAESRRHQELNRTMSEARPH